LSPRTRLALALVSALVVWGVPSGAHACPVCFGDAEGPIIDAARLGTFLLLGVTLAIQGAFVAFFLYLRRQARRAHDQALDAEWSSLQRAHDRAWRNV
jgi:uncharacterized membrane protein YccC